MTKRNRAQLINSLMDCTNIQSGIDDDAKIGSHARTYFCLSSQYSIVGKSHR